MALTNAQDNEKKQLQESIESTIEILEEIEKARSYYGEGSNPYEKAEEKLKEKKARSNFVVWYYNYFTYLESKRNLDFSQEEKKIYKKLALLQANKTCRAEWLQAQKNKIDTEDKFKQFLKYYLEKDRFMVLVLRVYENYDENIAVTKLFFKKALIDPDPIGFILRDLRENIKIIKERIYIVKKRDTLSSIARKFGKKWQDLAKHNNIPKPYTIEPGDKIKIPEQTINIPRHIDKTTQFCVLGADKLVKSDLEKITIAENTLAIVRTESSQGLNIGTASYHTAMKPSEKMEFLQLCLRLGLDPETTPVSKKPWYGWGGAMGAGQFLPSTWAACEADVGLMASTKYPSPYNLKHAVFATALKLTASGVASGDSDAEYKAAMRYFAGNNWDKKKYEFYWNKYVEPRLDKIKKTGEIRKLIFPEENKNVQE